MRTLTLKKGDSLSVNGELAAEIVEINRGSVIVRLLPSGKLVDAKPQKSPARTRRKRDPRLMPPVI